MNITTRLLVIAAAFTLAFSAAAHASTDADAAKKAAAKAENGKRLVAERDGTTVKLSWTVPEGKWKNAEVLRNDKETTRNRKRVKAVRTSATRSTDTLPDDGKTYWYWIKLTDADKKSTNLGPAKAE